MNPEFPEPTPRSQPTFLLARNARRTGSEAHLRRLHTRGEVTRLRTGVYMNTAEWQSANREDQYRFQVQAAAAILAAEVQFSHDSAAVLWGLPTLGPWPGRVHTLGARASGGRSHGTVTVHSLGSEEPGSSVDGLHVTTLARTLVDVARTSTFARAVGMIDHGLRLPRPGELRFDLEPSPPTATGLHELLESLLPIAGSVKARKAIDFADARSGSLLESLSRVQLMLLGLPRPELQVPFSDDEGFIGEVDFYWPDLHMIGEADGALKYDGENSPSGLPSPVVMKKEKTREDRLRRQVNGFVRWDWPTAYDRNRLAARVGPFGLRRT